MLLAPKPTNERLWTNFEFSPVSAENEDDHVESTANGSQQAGPQEPINHVMSEEMKNEILPSLQKATNMHVYANKVFN